MVYKGVIIEESLIDSHVLKDVHTTDVRIRIFGVNKPCHGHTQWILRLVEIPEDKVGNIAQKLSQALDPQYPWYSHFKSTTKHYVVFPGRVFVVDCFSKVQYEEMLKYAKSLGIATVHLEPPPAACKEWEL